MKKCEFTSRANSVQRTSLSSTQHIYYYYDLAQEDRIQVPLPGSRLFALSGGKWDDIVFYQDIALYLDVSNGNLYSQSGEFVY